MPFVETNGIETYYERRGSGPPVVFVHGSMVDHSHWLPQVEALADAYTTVVYDLRGHGRTGPSPVDAYTTDLFVEDLDALIATLDLGTPVLCGASMGGAIAQVYAATYPERVAGLVLADTFTGTRLDWRERLQWAFLRAMVVPVRLVGFERANGLNVWINELVNRGSGGDSESIDALTASGPSITTDEFAKVARAMTRFVDGDTDFDLRAIAVPTLVIYGEHEIGLVKRHARVLCAAIPDATRRVVPGGGHTSNRDDPAFFTAVLREFLAERVTAGTFTGT
jgi:pimeloyl-ACP methyl ester carboxylesterase